MPHELFITYCTNGTSIMNPSTYSTLVCIIAYMYPYKWLIMVIGETCLLKDHSGLYPTQAIDMGEGG